MIRHHQLPPSAAQELEGGISNGTNSNSATPQQMLPESELSVCDDSMDTIGSVVDGEDT